MIYLRAMLNIISCLAVYMIVHPVFCLFAGAVELLLVHMDSQAGEGVSRLTATTGSNQDM